MLLHNSTGHWSWVEDDYNSTDTCRIIIAAIAIAPMPRLWRPNRSILFGAEQGLAVHTCIGASRSWRASGAKAQQELRARRGARAATPAHCLGRCNVSHVVGSLSGRGATEHLSTHSMLRELAIGPTPPSYSRHLISSILVHRILIEYKIHSNIVYIHTSRSIRETHTFSMRRYDTF